MSDVKMEIVLAAKDVTARSFASVEKKISGLKTSVLSLNKVMAGVAAATGIGFFIKKNLEAADAIAKTADNIGISTKALQQWQFIADRSGVSAGQLNQGFGAFAKRIGELRAGTGALNTYLNKTNKALKNQLTATHSTSEALNIFLQALAGVKDQSERAAMSAAAFSRTAGIKLTNLVQNGTEGLAEMKKEFADLGLTIDDKFLRQSEKAVDQFTNLEFVIKSKLMQTVVEFTPEIIKITQEMVKWITQNDDLMKQNLSEYLHEAKTVVSGIYDLVKEINNFYMSLPEPVRGPMGIGLIGTILFGRKGIILLGLFASVDSHVREMQRKLEAISKLKNKTGDFQITFPINSQTPGYDLYDKKQTQFNGDLGLGEHYKQILEKLKKSRIDAQKDYVDSWELAFRDKDAVQARSIQASIDLEQQAIDEAVANAGTYKDSWIAADKERVAANQRALDELVKYDIERMQEINDFSTKVFSSMEDVWVEFCTTGKVTFSDFAKSVVADIARIEFEKSITDKFKPGLNNLLSAGLGLFFGSSFDSAPDPSSIHVGAGGTTAFHMHTGGIAGADTPQNASFMPTAMMASAPRFHTGLLPNEFPAILKKGEGVFTQKQMAALGQQNTAPVVQVNVINNTGTDTDVKQQSPKWDGEKWVIGVVLDAMKRNKGGFRTNFKSVMVK